MAVSLGCAGGAEKASFDRKLGAEIVIVDVRFAEGRAAISCDVYREFAVVVKSNMTSGGRAGGRK